MRISSKISWYLLTDAILMQDHRKNDQEDQTCLQTMKSLSLSEVKCSTMNIEHSWNTTPTSAIVIISRTIKGTRHYVDRPAVNLVELKSTAVTMLGSIVRHCTEYSQNSQRGNSLNIIEMFAIQKKKLTQQEYFSSVQKKCKRVQSNHQDPHQTSQHAKNRQTLCPCVV